MQRPHQLISPVNYIERAIFHFIQCFVCYWEGTVYWFENKNLIPYVA